MSKQEDRCARLGCLATTLPNQTRKNEKEGYKQTTGKTNKQQTKDQKQYARTQWGLTVF